jgi:hypothetical protein
MAWVEAMAKESRKSRSALAKDNPLLQMQDNVSQFIVTSLDAWRDMAERMSESTFVSIYGSPLLQAAVGIDRNDGTKQQPAKDPLHEQLVQARIAELRARIAEGGIREATVRALLYVGMSRGAIDERGFEAIRRIRKSQKDLAPLPIADFKALVREQHHMLLIDPSTAMAAIPSMLPPNPSVRAQAFDLIKHVLEASGALPAEGQERLRQVNDLFVDGADSPLAPVIDIKSKPTPAKPTRAGVVHNQGTKK